MLASITPLGERGRGRRWGVSVTAYVIGSLLGGAAVGGLAGGAGALLLDLASPSEQLRTAVVLLVLLAAVPLDLLARGRRVVGPRRQVNEDWLEAYREWVYGAGFGLQLGAGVLTQVTTAGVWALLVAAVVAGSPALGLALGGLFGLVRAAPVLATRSVQDAAALRRLHQRVAAAERRARAASTAALVVATLSVGGVLLAQTTGA